MTWENLSLKMINGRIDVPNFKRVENDPTYFLSPSARIINQSWNCCLQIRYTANFNFFNVYQILTNCTSCDCVLLLKALLWNCLTLVPKADNKFRFCERPTAGLLLSLLTKIPLNVLIWCLLYCLLLVSIQVIGSSSLSLSHYYSAAPMMLMEAVCNKARSFSMSVQKRVVTTFLYIVDFTIADYILFLSRCLYGH